MKVTVNKDACICCGQCARTCEAVFEIDEAEGYAVAKVAEVPEAEKNAAQDAVEGCPTGAIVAE